MEKIVIHATNAWIFEHFPDVSGVRRYDIRIAGRDFQVIPVSGVIGAAPGSAGWIELDRIRFIGEDD